MSRLLFDWLNEDLRLSRRVNNFDSDFANGFLIGEILMRYNQQSSFDKFVDKGSPDAKINNFCLLERPMTTIGIDFNTKIVYDISSGKADVIKKFLYELKTTLDLIVKSSSPSKSRILRIIPNSRPFYDQTKAMGFENAMRAIAENPNDIMIEKVVTKYRDRKVKFRQSVSMSHSDLVGALQSERLRAREVTLQRHEHENLFRNAWDYMNEEKWRLNQKIAHDRRDRERRFMETTQMNAINKTETYRQSLRDETLRSLDDFDTRMEKEVFCEDPDLQETVGKSIQRTVQGKMDSGAQNIMYIDESYLHAGLEKAQKTIKENFEDSQLRTQAHDRRRRRFIREREFLRSSDMEKGSNEEVLAQLYLPSHAEKLEDLTSIRIQTFKKIFVENRENREAKIQSLDLDRQSRSEAWRGEKYRRELEWIVMPEIQCQNHRVDLFDEAMKSASHQESLVLVTETIDRLLELVDWTVTCRAFGNFTLKIQSPSSLPNNDSIEEQSCLLPLPIWKDVVHLFVSKLPMSRSLPLLTPIHVVTSVPYCFGAQPCCMTPSNWLLQQIFTTHTILTEDDGLNHVVEEFSGNSISVHAAWPESLPLPQERTLSQNLSQQDMQVFTDLISKYGIEHCDHVDSQDTSAAALSSSSSSLEKQLDLSVEGQSLGPNSDSQLVATSSDSSSLYYLSTPGWLQGDAKHLLGDTIIEISCQANPLPVLADPSSRIYAQFRIKLSLSILSHVLRRQCIESLQLIFPEICVVSLESLICSLLESQTSSTPEYDVLASQNDSEDGEKLQNIVSILQNGQVVSDDLYVFLICRHLRKLAATDAKNFQRGFVLIDFPRTPSQALLLFHEFSGIHYDHPCPQPLDRQSAFVAPSTRPLLKYDPLLCGLDGMVSLEYSPSENFTLALREDISVRQDLQHPQQDVTYLMNHQGPIERDSMEFLHEVYRPRHPIATCGVELWNGDNQRQELHQFFQAMNLQWSFVIDPFTFPVEQQAKMVEMTLRSFLVLKYPELVVLETTTSESKDQQFEEGVENQAKEEEEAGKCVSNNDHDNFSNDVIDGDATLRDVSKAIEHHEGGEAVAATAAATATATATVIATATSENDSSMGTNNDSSKPSPSIALGKPRTVSWSSKRALIFEKLWKESEKMSRESSRGYFASIRDLRVQYVQRRRGVLDTLQYYLLQSDSRQQLYGEFMTAFNSFDLDFRYDLDCMSELHLRNLEFQEQLFALCDDRKKINEDFLRTVTEDGMLALLIHRCQSEGAFLMQTELNRFYAALHVLFDASKGFQGFDSRVKLENNLEITLPLVPPTEESVLASMTAAATGASKDSKGGKGEAKGKANDKKKGKEEVVPTAVPFRQALAPILLPLTVLRALPVPQSSQAEAANEALAKDPKKAKPASKDAKKGAEEVKIQPPHLMMESSIVELIQESWSRDKFTVQRVLFHDDESLCQIVEKAVWHEADRLLFSISQIKSMVESEVQWFQKQEEELLQICRHEIDHRYALELSIVDRLGDIIGDTIECHQPLRSLFALAPDVITIKENALLVPDPVEDPIPELIPYFDDHLNEDQKNILMMWLNDLCSENRIVLNDVKNVLDRSQYSRHVEGSYFIDCKTLEGKSSCPCVVQDICLPAKFRLSDENKESENSLGQEIRSRLLFNAPIAGLEQHVGTVPLSTILTEFQL